MTGPEYLVVEDLGQWLVVQTVPGAQAVVVSRWDSKAKAEADACRWYDLASEVRS